MTVRGFTVMERHFDGHRECADEREILLILAKDPKLAPFKPLIDKIIKVLCRHTEGHLHTRSAGQLRGAASAYGHVRGLVPTENS